jgi:hypothetical protein
MLQTGNLKEISDSSEGKQQTEGKYFSDENTAS